MRTKAGNLEIDQYLDQEINKYLNALPEQEQRDMGIMAYQTDITAFTEQDKLNEIEDRMNFYSLKDQYESADDYKTELLDMFCRLDLDVTQTITELKEEIRSTLANMSLKQLWQEGYIFKGTSESDAAHNRTMVIEGFKINLTRIAVGMDTNSRLEAALGDVIEFIREKFRQPIVPPALLIWSRN